MVLLFTNILLQASAYTNLVNACNNKDMAGCYELGKHFLSRGEFQKAIRYHTLACDNNYFKSCIKLGVMYQYGKGRKKNISKAAKYYKDVCKKGDGLGCTMMGELVINSQLGSTKEAFDYFKEACKKGDGDGCLKYAYYHRSNTYTKKDFSIAVDYYEKACENDRHKCLSLGDAYANGELGLKIDYVKARKYYTKACKGENAFGCYRLGNLYYKGYGVEQSYTKAKIYYEQSCSGSYLNGTEKGCNNLAVLYHYGRGVKRDIALAKKYYKKACAKEYFKACETLKILK